MSDLDLNRYQREIIRRKFMTRFGVARSIAEGFYVKRWASGSSKGQPKLTSPVQSMLNRGLVTISDAGAWPRVLFTDKGLRALKRMAADGCALDPERHRHLIEELAQIPGDGS